MPEEVDGVGELVAGDEDESSQLITGTHPAQQLQGVSFGTLVKVIGGFGTIIAVIITLVGYGFKLGEIKKQIDDNTDAIGDLEDHPNNCRANLGKLRTAVQERFRQDSNEVSEIRGSLMALRTEVRVRHEERVFMPRMIPSYKASMPGSAPGHDPSGGPHKVSVKLKGERPPPQHVQENLAAEATDLEIEQALEAAPMEDPLESLTFDEE